MRDRGMAITVVLAVALLGALALNLLRVPGVAAQATGPAGSSYGFNVSGTNNCDSPDSAHVYVCGSSTFTHGVGVSVKGAAYSDPFVGFPAQASQCNLKITSINSDGSWTVAITACK
jgi:hypothetical protein